MKKRMGEIEQLGDGTWLVVVDGVEYVYQTRQQAMEVGNYLLSQPVGHRIGNRRHGK